ncbi:MAG: hypothetical protein AAB471_00460 [Patescibacteria group bacterium]
MNLENFEDHGRNDVQMALANELYGESGLNEDEILNRWVAEGYAKRFGDYMYEHPDMEDRLFVEKDDEAFEDLKRNILLH